MSDTIQNDGLTEANCNEETKVEYISPTKGYWFYFQDGEDEIAVFGSGWSGKEIVYFNDNPVSESRNMKFKSIHEFTANGKHYRIVYEVVSMLKGQVKCKLFINDEQTDEQDKAVLVKEGRMSWTALIVSFIIGMALGYSFVSLLVWFFD